MAAAQTVENNVDEWGLAWYLDEGYIYQVQLEPTLKIH